MQINPIIKEVCTEEKFLELNEIHKAIEECEKNLNIYLEEKKKFFARFYFVSNQTLIDILANGNNPRKIVSEYLGDLFDGINRLKMIDNPENKMAVPLGVAMEAKDGEVVPFNSPFEPKDEVEIWLNRLENKMRNEMQMVLHESKKTAEANFYNPEVPEAEKMDWISQFCAQIALLTV